MRGGSSTGSSNFETLFDLGDKTARRDELNAEMEAPNFWADQERAKGIIAELKTLNGVLKPFEALTRQSDDLQALIELADEDGGSDFDGAADLLRSGINGGDGHDSALRSGLSILVLGVTVLIPLLNARLRCDEADHGRRDDCEDAGHK